MDKIFLRDLKIDTVIGVYDWEREIQQTLQFDFELDWDIRPAAETDNIDLTLDYASLTQTVVEFVQTSRFELIETLAERVAALLLASYPIPRLKLTLSKPVKIHGDNLAQIIIERTR